MNPKPFDTSSAICGSAFGLALAFHLLLLVLLPRVSPSGYEAAFLVCLSWPLLVPLAFVFGLAALWHIITSSGGGTARRVCLGVAIVGIVGTGICAYYVGSVVRAIMELH